ncbi:PRP38-domain-containing protein [Coccomyxa subellipsoidea C-169]|uniref:Pre-mRNA-splicing factor 38 n=1 Tax=Coccomyxa subellipsoidea (strain C-169) TaxID=574566 RepID=I0YZI6_COCSC|nr:PRP38-domain-containing protein [Coccomyxa subellipsoidea C-169]EIE23805.1 PRP38-domain-containing protein [Coccomyxa subellipsoidea C-169]|eukprot:XP_005648349.1 PRP38-domain-containing protein [Coccomyxa subellipsoidea C-169]
MANRTDPDARSVHGTNPQNLVEKILRMKIYSSMYWKEHCFALTAESLVDKAVDLKYVGGTFGGQRAPTQFMCLMLKLLQLQPEKEIIVEFIKNEDYKYVRILGAFYLRLVGRPLEVYQYLEPLYNDYRKVRLRNADGNFALTHMDEIIDQMLYSEYLFDVAMPRIPNRVTMERLSLLEPRISVLEDDFDEDMLEAEAGNAAAAAREKDRDKERERDRDRERGRDRDRDRERHRPRDREREHDRDRDRRDADRDRGRDRDRERERDGDRKRRREEDDRGGRKERKDGDGISVEETNAMRIKLGMKPLK